MSAEPEAAGRNARRWTVKAHIDDNVCQPCEDNDGKVYRNRKAAWRDYPNGRGYRKCVGAQYGNTCRCTVVRRGKDGTNMGQDLASLINKAMTLTSTIEARKLLPTTPVGALALPDFQALHMQDNALYVYDAIGGWDGAKAIDVAMALRDMTGPLDVHLNSPGGVIFEGAAMYNAIKMYGRTNTVTCYIDGYAASAASFVALAASPYDPVADTGGVRIAANGAMMIHDGMGIAMGTADDMRDVADLLDMLSDTIAEIYANRTGTPAAEWRDTMRDGDTWYNAAAALDAKLVDVIIPDVEPDPEDDPGPGNTLDLDLFTVDMPVAPAATAQPPFDLEGFRIALKGVLA